MNRKGFTLIELLIVVVIIGILAAIAIPKFANTKGKAYIASMKSDLRNLVTAEEAYFADSVKYSATTTCATPPAAGAVNFCVTTGNTLGAIGLAAGNGGWSVTISNANLQTPTVTTCAIFINTAALAPATTEGAPACQ
jgi:type IV pilus assembly protein PilA